MCERDIDREGESEKERDRKRERECEKKGETGQNIADKIKYIYYSNFYYIITE